MTAAAVATGTTRATNQSTNPETGDHPNKEAGWTKVTQKGKMNPPAKSTTETTAETTAKVSITEATTTIEATSTSTTKATAAVTQSPASSHKEEKKKASTGRTSWRHGHINKLKKEEGQPEHIWGEKNFAKRVNPNRIPNRNINHKPNYNLKLSYRFYHNSSTQQKSHHLKQNIPYPYIRSSPIPNTVLSFSSQAVLSVSFRNQKPPVIIHTTNSPKNQLGLKRGPTRTNRNHFLHQNTNHRLLTKKDTKTIDIFKSNRCPQKCYKPIPL